MDLTKITDVDKLKSLAYDQLAQKQVAEQNLQAISQRLEEVIAKLNKQQAKQNKPAQKPSKK